MKKFIIYTALLLLLYDTSYSQNLVIKGRVRCMNQSAHSTKGAENVIVVPTFVPSKSAITVTSPSGYFEFNTGTNLTTLQDKQVSIYIVSKCSSCKDLVKRVFISEDQDRQNRDDSKSYVTIKKWMLEKRCNEVELPAFRADSLLMVIKKQPEEKLSELTNVTAVAGTPALLNLLTTLTTIVPIQNFGVFTAKDLFEGKINYGSFLFSSAMINTGNMGFNFSPHRDMSEAAFWSPASIVNSKKPNNVTLFTNVKNNARLNAFFRLTDKVSLGIGGIYTRQDEFRKVRYFRLDPVFPDDTTFLEIPSVFMKLQEYAAYLSPSYKINNQLSVGVSVKSIWQDFTIPKEVDIQQDNNNVVTNDFTDLEIKEQKFDVDFSVIYKVTKSLQVGINVMNLAGAKLYADAFTEVRPETSFQNQRAFGLGLCYKYQRFNFGVDILATEDDFYDATFGVNYVPFNDALISAGIAVKQLSYSLAFRLKHFRLAYIDDNDWLVNEKRKGKSGILNGRLYGGFAFNF